MNRRSYFVCATERSGSTLLCELLAGTGVAGCPEEYFETLAATGRPRQPREYFDGVDDPSILDLLPPLLAPVPQLAWADRVADALRRGTTPNGVFGSKMMWAHLGDFLAHSDDPEEILGPLHWVLVVRDDKLGQAISLWRAIQTSQWRAEDPGEEHEPVFHAGAIAHLKERLDRHERNWREWFAERGVEPLELGYEELCTDPSAAVRRVLQLAGLPCGPEVAIPEPPLRRQADDRSREWATRYLMEVPA